MVGLAIPAAALALLLGFRDAGASDPFLGADSAFARAHGLRLRVWPGGHDGSYWASHLRDYLRFYAQALRSCRR